MINLVNLQKKSLNWTNHIIIRPYIWLEHVHILLINGIIHIIEILGIKKYPKIMSLMLLVLNKIVELEQEDFLGQKKCNYLHVCS